MNFSSLVLAGEELEVEVVGGKFPAVVGGLALEGHFHGAGHGIGNRDSNFLGRAGACLKIEDGGNCQWERGELVHLGDKIPR